MNPFDILNIVDESILIAYRGVYQSLVPSAEQMASTFFGFWFFRILFDALLNRGFSYNNIGQTFIYYLIFSLFVIRWNFAVEYLLPIVIDYPNYLGNQIIGESASNVFASYSNAVNERLLIADNNLDWKDIAGQITLLVFGHICLVLLIVATLAILVIAKFALGILLSVFPLFAVLFIWDSTRNLFIGYFRLTLNYMLMSFLITILLGFSIVIFEFVLDSASTDVIKNTKNLMALGIIHLLIFVFVQKIPMIAMGLAGGMVLSGSNLGERLLKGFSQSRASKINQQRSDQQYERRLQQAQDKQIETKTALLDIERDHIDQKAVINTVSPIDQALAARQSETITRS